MGATNNSLVKIKDIKKSGGILTENFSIDENKLLKDIEITTSQQQTGQVHSGPLCYNVTLKNEYGNDHLTKFQDLDIAETYPITLQVTLPSAQWTGYTLHGFTAKVTYPNGAIKNKFIDIIKTTADKNIEIKNCCDNAKVKVSASFRSGATISTTAKTVNADVAINSLFTEDDGLICTGTNSYSCFTLTQGFTPGGPVVTGGTNDGQIVISINTTNMPSNSLFIKSAKYATGATPLEGQNPSSLTWTTISGLTASSVVEATISVPVRAYVVIYLTDPVDKNSVNATTYKWKEGTHQYVQSGLLPVSVTYTAIPSNS